VLSGTDWGSISATATGLIVSGSLAGALLGSALAFLVADPLGEQGLTPLPGENYPSAPVRNLKKATDLMQRWPAGQGASALLVARASPVQCH